MSALILLIAMPMIGMKDTRLIELTPRSPTTPFRQMRVIADRLLDTLCPFGRMAFAEDGEVVERYRHVRIA
jgi:hypothetical protein